MKEENSVPQKIFFVSWKQHKVEQSLSHTKAITDEFFNEIIFRTIIDFNRNKYGFPSAFSLQEIVENEPVVPVSPLNVQNFITDQQDRRMHKCPVCEEPVDARLFTSHLESCIKKCKPLSIACKISTMHSD